LLESILELGAADVGEVVEEPGIGWRVAYDAEQLGCWNPRVAVLDVGDDVGDRASIDSQRKALASLELCDYRGG
jgi:hypothetical protein